MKTREKTSERKIDLLLILSTAAVFIAVAILSDLEKALVSGLAFGVFFSIVSLKWESRRDRRFWGVITVFAIIHIVAIALMKFPKLGFGLISLPFAFVDGFIMWWILIWIEKRFPRTP